MTYHNELERSAERAFIADAELAAACYQHLAAYRAERDSPHLAILHQHYRGQISATDAFWLRRIELAQDAGAMVAATIDIGAPPAPSRLDDYQS